MSRYIKDFPAPGFPEPLFQSIYNYLISEGYEYTRFRDDQLFKKGHGLVAAPSFLKLSYVNNCIRVEAWIKYALLPGVYISEMDLNGFVGSAIKKPLKKRVTQVEGMIMQFTGSTPAYDAPSPAPYGVQPQQLYNVQPQQPYNSQPPQQPVYNAPSQTLKGTLLQSAPTKSCLYCGSQIDASADFCGYCGKRQ